jgi:hypothetical protein
MPNGNHECVIGRLPFGAEAAHLISIGAEQFGVEHRRRQMSPGFPHRHQPHHLAQRRGIFGDILGRRAGDIRRRPDSRMEVAG